MQYAAMRCISVPAVCSGGMAAVAAGQDAAESHEAAHSAEPLAHGVDLGSVYWYVPRDPAEHVFLFLPALFPVSHLPL